MSCSLHWAAAKDNALGFTNRTLGGLMFWVGLRKRLMAFSESIDHMRRRSSFSCPEEEDESERSSTRTRC
nr:hypothetical protein Itr_chr14CG07170 [Ipomoea trifida]